MFNLFKSNEQKFKDKLEEYFYTLLKRSVMDDSDMGSDTVVTMQKQSNPNISFKLKCGSLIEAVSKISDWLRHNQNFCVSMSISTDSEDFEPKLYSDGEPVGKFPMEKFCCIYVGDDCYAKHLIIRFYVEKK